MSTQKRNKNYLMNRVSSLPLVYRSNIDKALHKHSNDVKERERIQDEEKQETIPAKLFVSHLREFNKDLRDKKKVYMVLKEENDDFLEKYKKSVNKQKKLGIRPSFHSIFIDMIHLYKDKKGYIIKDLSKKNNLFELSPLLLENNKIVPSFRMVDNTPIYYNDLSYLEKINEMVSEKLNIEENGKNKKNIQRKINQKQFITSTEDLGYQKTQKMISKRDLIEQVEENIKSINNTKKTIESNDFKKLFLNKEKQSMNSDNKRNSVDQKQNGSNNTQKKNSKNLNVIHGNSKSIDLGINNSAKRSSMILNRRVSPINHRLSKISFNKKLIMNKHHQLVNMEYERIVDEIDDKVQSKMEPILEYLVDGIDRHEADHERIIKYMKLKENERPLFRDINKLYYFL